MRLPTENDIIEAQEIVALAGGAKRFLDERAVLEVRCTDCDGERIAGVAWASGRPLAVLRHRGEPFGRRRRLPWHWKREWADCGSRHHARCHNRWHPLRTDELLKRMPRQGAASNAVWPVSHTNPTGAL